MSWVAGAYPVAARAVTLPDRVRAGVEDVLGVQITGAVALGGGCISPAYRIMCAEGESIFLKTAPAGGADDMLKQESLSLERIAATGAVRVPEVHGVAVEWLALEWLEPEAPTSDGWRNLGAALARLHRRRRGERYGWESANYIGTLPQQNDFGEDWAAFWRDQRIAPQLRLAADRLGVAVAGEFERLLDRLDDVLSDAAAEGPSLLHGDLWNGNVHFTRSGGALIDPSSYYGHREVDLAMAALFGGFPPEFFDAYSAEWPLRPGVHARRPIYQLYYLLVHVNLFGGGYVDQTIRVLRSAG